MKSVFLPGFLLGLLAVGSYNSNDAPKPEALTIADMDTLMHAHG